MNIRLIQVPYHLGRRCLGMGLGPLRYLGAGADSILREPSHLVEVESVDTNGKFKDELKAIIDVDSHLAKCVNTALSDGFFPMILGGNCNTCLGTLAGIGSSQIGIIWFDAHGDFNTPETTPSGFFDGMPLAISVGKCHEAIWTSIGNSNPIPESQVILAGVRDLDPEEKKLLESSKVQVVTADKMKGTGLKRGFLPKLLELQRKVKEIYLHLDIDVISTLEAPGVDFRCPGGLSSDELEPAIWMIAKHFKIKAAALTAYNPQYEEEDKTLKTGLHLLNIIVEAAAQSASSEFSQ